MLKFSCAREFILQHPGLHPSCTTGALYDGTVGHGTASHEESNPDHSIITRQTHFRTRSVFHGVEQRDDCRRREIDIIKVSAEFVNNLTEIKRDLLQLWSQAVILLTQKCGE